MNDTYVKVFVEEREMTVMLVGRPLGQPALRHARAPQGARRGRGRGAARVQRHQATTTASGLILCTDRSRSIVPPKKGEKHVMRVVREISGCVPERTGTDLQARARDLDHGRAPAQRGVRASAISSRAATSARSPSRRPRHDVIPVMLVDPREEELPDVGLAQLRRLRDRRAA